MAGSQTRIKLIVTLLMLLKFVASAQIPRDPYLKFQIDSISPTNMSGLVQDLEMHVLYEFQYKQSRTNWMSLAFFYGPEMTNCIRFNFTTNDLIHVIDFKLFRVRSWKESNHDGIPDWWKMKYFGDPFIDAFATPMGDGWFTIEKFKRGMDPFKWYPPPGPDSKYEYAVPAHFPEPPPFAKMTNITSTTISNTMLKVKAKLQTNGYALKVLHPLVHARYLLLVRDKNDRQWRASGYFVSGTNREPVTLHVDTKGMMTDPQFPLTLPPINFLPHVVDPEFTAGWGEDSDGDGLPDIYEVLVTHTKPDDEDTGVTGMPDGYKIVSNDGWNNWNKFRYRANPLIHYDPPAATILIRPTLAELMRAQEATTDLPYVSQLEIRTNGISGFQHYSLAVDVYLPRNLNQRGKGDVRVYWKLPPWIPFDLNQHP